MSDATLGVNGMMFNHPTALPDLARAEFPAQALPVDLCQPVSIEF
jgi:hypothetical protein